MITNISYSLPTGRLSVVLDSVREDQSEWPFSRCLGIGARRNPKRGFIFVSKVLGKHIPVCPITILETHEALAERLLEALPKSEPALFIAMAETATGLGHGVYEAAFSKVNPDVPWYFLTSTRYKVNGAERFQFEEEHCHAPDQWIHKPNIPHSLKDIRTLVLIDDEVTTGSTLLNVENCLKADLTGLESVIWVSLGAFRSDLPRHCISLFEAEYDFKPTSRLQPEGNSEGDSNKDVTERMNLNWGRLGLHGVAKLSDEALAAVDKAVEDWIPNMKPVMVLGQGEFMHAAFRIALAMSQRGVATVVQSTTRSPIMIYGAIERKLSVPDPLDTGVDHYAYNLDPDAYSKIIVVAEKPGCDQSKKLCDQLGNAVAVAA